MAGKSENGQLKTMFLGLLMVFFFFLALAIYKRKEIIALSSVEEGFQSSHSGIGSQNRETPDIYYRFFYADWCPHCQTTKPEWEKCQTNWNMLKRQLYWENNKINYQHIKLEKINCEKNGATCRQFDVQSYPTIVLSIGPKNIEYVGNDRSHTELMRFLETKLLENGFRYES